jgi:hypothetical protein
MAAQVLPKALVKGTKAWMVRTTRDNLVMLRKALAKTGRSVTEIDEIIGYFEARVRELDRSEQAVNPNPPG